MARGAAFWLPPTAGASSPPVGEPVDTAAAAPLRFDSEVVRLRVSGDTLHVTGIYLFLCAAGMRPTATLFYPFPEDSLLGAARMVSLECRAPNDPPDEWQTIPFAATQHRPGARWSIPLDRGDSLIVCARYQQQLRGPFARYILTSTQAWGTPLRHARFEVTLPEAAELTSSSYPLAGQMEGGRRRYVAEFADFMPDRDLTVSWSP